MEEPRVGDRHGGDPADGLDGGDVVVRERSVPCRVEQLHDADHALLDEQRDDQTSVASTLARVRLTPFVESAVPAGGPHDGARLHGEARGAPVVEVVGARQPAPRRGPPQQAGLAAQVPAVEGVHGTGVHVGDVAKPSRDRLQHAGEVETGGELQTGLVDLAQAGRAFVEGCVDAGVRDRLRGDLREAAEEVGVGDVGMLEIEEGRDADRLAAVDEREARRDWSSPTEILGTFDLGEAWIVDDIGDDHGLAQVDGAARDGEVGEVVGGAGERIVDRRAIGADEPDEAFALDGVDVTARRGGRAGTSATTRSAGPR